MTGHRKETRRVPQIGGEPAKAKISLPKQAKEDLQGSARPIPIGAVIADCSKQVKNSSYAGPPLYYVDIEFECLDCGRKETWTGRQQKWYYEVAKGSLYATAVRCKTCRRKQSGTNGDPKPVNNLRSLFKRIRNAVEPSLIQAGFCLDPKIRNPDAGFSVLRRTYSINYSRSGLILEVRVDVLKGRLIAEILDIANEPVLVAEIELTTYPNWKLLESIDSFTSSLNEYIQYLN